LIRVGLTGGCSTGKSTVASMFSRLGAEVINADDIVHKLLRENDRVKSAVVSLFGEEVRAADGSVNREKLAQIVFTDRNKLKQLTDLLYPKVRYEIQRFFNTARRQAGSDICVAEVPLLIEGGALHLYDVIVVVNATYQNQLKRFLEKGGKSKADLDKRIANQMDMTEKLKLADYVINNDGSIEQTFNQVKTVYNSIRLQKGARTASIHERPSAVTANNAPTKEANQRSHCL
jgi:dephospho-CoA kinase